VTGSLGNRLKDAHENEIWQQCHEGALELEAFEPGLSGLAPMLADLENGQAPSEVWMTKAKQHLWQNHAAAALSLNVNQIAGLYFGRNEFEKARVIAQCAYDLHRACFGDDNEVSVVLARNIEKLEAATPPKKKLPKLRNFAREPRRE